MHQMMPRSTSKLTLLHRFTLASAFIALVLAVTLSLVTVRVLTVFVVQDEAEVATELILRTLAPQLRADDMRTSLSPDRQILLDSLFRAHGISDKILRVRLWRADGRLLYSNRPEENRLPAVTADLRTPAGYQQFVATRRGAENDAADQARVFVPVQVAGAGAVLGAFEIFYDLNVLHQRLGYVRRVIWSVVPAGLFILYASVYVLVQRSSRRLTKQQEDLVAAHLGTYRALVGAIDAKDSYTDAHSLKVTRLAERLGGAVGLAENAIADLHVAGRLHDIGKIAVPDAILMKPGPLSVEEWVTMRAHAEAGYAILRDAPLSDRIKLAVRHNHERWDGMGYPGALVGEAIPLFSRILAIADAYEAMISDRPYRRAITEAEALAELRAGAGTQFDPRLVDAFVDRVLTLQIGRAYNEPISRAEVAVS